MPAISTNRDVHQKPRPQLLVQAIKADLDAIEKNCKVRNSRANPRRAVELYDEYVQLKLEADTLRAGECGMEYCKLD